MTEITPIDSVSLFRVRPIIGVGTPLLIVAVTSTDRQKWHGEMYLLLHDADCTILPADRQADVSEWASAGMTLNEVTLHDDLVQQARTRYTIHRQNKGQDDSDQLELARVEVTELVSLWRQSPCGHRLRQIERQTVSEQLRRRLNVALSRQKLDDEMAITQNPAPPSRFE